MSATQTNVEHLTRQARLLRLKVGLHVGLTVTLIVLLIWLGSLFEPVRLGMTDIFFVPHDTSGKVVIVAIDDDSLAAYGRSMVEWPRSVHAQLVDQLSQAGARVVAFDVLFDRPSADDDLLAQSIARARIETDARTRVVMPVVGAGRGPADTATTTSFVYFLLPVDSLRNEVAALGHTNAIPDVDGTVRWLPTRISAGQESYLSFSLVTTLAYLRIPAAAFNQVVTFRDHKLYLTAEHPIPLADGGRMRINFFSKPGDGRFPVYSYRAVIEGKVDPAAFYDKIVLVGPMNQAVSSDSYAVPTSSRRDMMSGVEVHANVIETILQNQPLSAQSRLSQGVTLVFLALLASLLYAFASRRWYWLALALGGMLLAWAVGAVTVFNLRHQVLNLLDPLFALVLPAPVTLIANTMLETRRRQQTELLLGSIVAASHQQLSLDHILPGLAQDVQQMTRCSDAEIWLWEARTGLPQRAYPPLPEESPVLDPQPPNDLIMRAITRGALVYEAGQLAVPFLWQGEPVGALFAHFQGHLTRSTRTMLDLFAWQTASIIANARLYAETTELSSAKTNMIRMVSHDLKNPLTIVTMGCDMILDYSPGDTPLNENQTRYIGMINNAANQMDALINEILNLERARRGTGIVELYDLPSLIAEVALHHQPTLEQKEQTFVLDLPPTFQPLSGDPTQIKQVFNNVLGNAIKYTPAQGRITLRLTRTDRGALVAVEDTGYGIPRDAQARLFQEFYRVRTEKTANIPGTGLGLSLVKTIVESHRGRVWVQSEEGAGSTFFVELPFPHA